jgi:hypothetical protein
VQFLKPLANYAFLRLMGGHPFRHFRTELRTPGVAGATAAPAQRHGHDGKLLTSSARPEQFVEQAAEPCFEYVDFGVRDRHARRPIVDDAPGLNVVVDRTAKAGPRARHGIEIERQFAECGAVAQGGPCRDIAAGSREQRKSGTTQS